MIHHTCVSTDLLECLPGGPAFEGQEGAEATGHGTQQQLEQRTHALPVVVQLAALVERRQYRDRGGQGRRVPSHSQSRHPLLIQTRVETVHESRAPLILSPTVLSSPLSLPPSSLPELPRDADEASVHGLLRGQRPGCLRLSDGLALLRLLIERQHMHAVDTMACRDQVALADPHRLRLGGMTAASCLPASLP